MTPSSQADLEDVQEQLSDLIGNREVYTGLMVDDIPAESPLWKKPVEPSGDGNCVTLNLRGSWLLNDLWCGNPRGYVCQTGGH